MKIFSLSLSGISPAVPKELSSPRGQYLAFTHGEEGRGRWQYRIPLSSKDFPPVKDKNYSNENFKLIPLNKFDSRNNPLFVLIKAAEPDDLQLILWSLSPGFRGGASYNVEGKAQILAKGEEAQGDAGRMGGAACPVVLVSGPCRLMWTRSGRLYGSAAHWQAEFDGTQWIVAFADECEIQNAAFDY